GRETLYASHSAPALSVPGRAPVGSPSPWQRHLAVSALCTSSCSFRQRLLIATAPDLSSASSIVHEILRPPQHTTNPRFWALSERTFERAFPQHASSDASPRGSEKL